MVSCSRQGLISFCFLQSDRQLKVTGIIIEGREGRTQDGCVRAGIRQRTEEEQIVYTVDWGTTKLSTGTVVSDYEGRDSLI